MPTSCWISRPLTGRSASAPTQTNWIGRSEGAEVTFKTESGDDIVVFTTRPDTLWGATFMVLAPEHPLVSKLTAPQHRDAVADYQFQAGRQTEIERTLDRQGKDRRLHRAPMPSIR